MRLLVLGGTRYVGYYVVVAARAAGHEATVFNRGISGESPPGARTIRGDRTNPRDISELAGAGPWDAVIDTSGYVPRNVLAVAGALAPVAHRYVFMSTVSVYEGWPNEPLTDESPILYCPADAGPDYGVDVENGPTRYGYQKAGCEAAGVSAFGPDRTTILRPGVVLGPREYVGRLPWWLRRVARGGRVVAPDRPERQIQPVDVRDLAEFAIACGTAGTVGSFNVTNEAAGTFGDLLELCAATTEGQPDFVWVQDKTLTRLGIRQWSEMPLWRTAPGTWSVGSSSAIAAGLRCRPLRETVLSTWQWMQESGPELDDERAQEIGLSEEKERLVLNAA